MSDFEVHGFKELDRSLKRLNAVVALKEMRSAMRVAGNVIRKAARQNAPARTGALRKGIKVGTAVRKQEGVVESTISTGRKQFYGMFLEFGTRYIPARPWFKPAVEQTRGDIVSRMREHLWRRIRKLTGAR